MPSPAGVIAPTTASPDTRVASTGTGTVGHRLMLVGTPERTRSLDQLVARADAAAQVVAERRSAADAVDALDSTEVDLVIVDMAVIGVVDDLGWLRQLLIWPQMPTAILIAETSEQRTKLTGIDRLQRTPVVDCGSAAAQLVAAMPVASRRLSHGEHPLHTDIVASICSTPSNRGRRSRPTASDSYHAGKIIEHFLRGRSAEEIGLIVQMSDDIVVTLLLDTMRRWGATSRDDLRAALLREAHRRGQHT